MFQTDELVVYPAQGVGKIERIAHDEISGVQCEFYIVRIVSSNITLMVPVNNALNVGLRPLSDQEKAQDILNLLCSDEKKPVHTGQNWNRRFREYSEKLKSVDLIEVAKVVRELLLIGQNKELSFGERRMLEQAMQLIIGELAEVLDMTEQELKDKIHAYYPSNIVKE